MVSSSRVGARTRKQPASSTTKMSCSLPIACPECDKAMHKSSFYRHLRDVHDYSEDQCEEIKESQVKEFSRIVCPLCQQKQASHAGLAKHCAMNHAKDGAKGQPQNYEVFVRKFPSEDEYQQWLTTQCEKNCTSFRHRSFEQKGGGSKRRLWCSQAGQYLRSGSAKRKRSSKDVQYCSSFLNVHTRKDGVVNVIGCFGHVGHAVGPSLPNPSPQEVEKAENLLDDQAKTCALQRLRTDRRPKKASIKDYFTNLATKVDRDRKCSCKTTNDKRRSLCEKCVYDACFSSERFSDYIDTQRPVDKRQARNLQPTGKVLQESEVCRKRKVANSKPTQKIRCEEPSHHQETITEQRRKQRYQKLNAIAKTYAAIEMRAKLLADSDTDEALQELNAIEDLINRAAAVEPVLTNQPATNIKLVKEETETSFQEVVLDAQGQIKIKEEQKEVFTSEM